MRGCNAIEDGFYRLVKVVEDNNPVFPCPDVVVELRGGEVINISTGRTCSLEALAASRDFYGPLKSAYDMTPVSSLACLHRAAVPAGVESAGPRSYPGS